MLLVFHELLVLLTLLVSGCGDDPARPAAITPAGEPLILVVNSLGETLALVRPDSLTFTPNALLLGDIPNDVAISAAGDLALVVDSGDNDLLLIGLADSLSILGSVDFGANANPWSVAFAGDGTAFVSLWLAGEVARVDLASRTVTARYPVGRTPQALLPLGEHLLVTLTRFELPGGFGAGEVAVLDASTGAVVRRIAVGVNPASAAVAPDGRIHVICTGNYGAYDPPVRGTIYVLDASAEAVVDSIVIGGSPAAVAFTDGGKAYVGGDAGGLLAYDATTLAFLAPPGAPLLPVDGIFDLAWDRRRDRLYAVVFNEDLLYVLDSTADTLLTAVPLGDGPVALALRP